jgi:hypothetical protein
MSIRPLFALLVATLSAGCAVSSQADRGDEATIGDDSEAVRPTGDTFVSIERDLRRCAWPICGGFYVTSLEDGLLACANGKAARTCYVSTLDLGALEPSRGALLAGMEQHATIVSGHVSSPKKVSTFVTSKAWIAPAPGPATGDLFLVTAKTATTHWALRLGLSRRRSFDALDLGAAPGTDADWAALEAAAATSDGPIVAGTITKAKILEATQFWLPVSAKPVTVCGSDLDTRLASAASGLLWPSESDYPVDVFHPVAPTGSAPLTIEELRAILGVDATVTIEAPSYASVMDARTQVQDWMDEGQIATAKQFLVLRTALEADLTNLQVFRVGTVSIDVYVVGRSACGELVGVKSTVIET